MHITIIGAMPRSLINFRGDLLKALVAAGHKVTAMADGSDPGIAEKLAEIGVEFRSYPVQRNPPHPFRPASLSRNEAYFNDLSCARC